MTKQELIELCSLGESTTVQYKLEFTTQKQIAEVLVAFANTRGGIIVFGAEDKTGRMVGLGSGIPRVMATGCDVELIDRPDGNQFAARIWRTTQKDEITTQKANKELDSTTQKNGLATQKSGVTTQKPLNATQKRILEHLRHYPKATRQDVADALGDITVDGVKFNIGLLQQYGALRRKGDRKNGEWEVLAIL